MERPDAFVCVRASTKRHSFNSNMPLRFVVAASNQTMNPFAEALNHVTQWNPIRQVQNLWQLFFEVHGPPQSTRPILEESPIAPDWPCSSSSQDPGSERGSHSGSPRLA
jgi:hypothetical protein